MGAIPKSHKTVTFVNDQGLELEVITSTNKANQARLKKLGYYRKDPKPVKEETPVEETPVEETKEEAPSEEAQEEPTEEEAATEEEEAPAPRRTTRRR